MFVSRFVHPLCAVCVIGCLMLAPVKEEAANAPSLRWKKEVGHCRVLTAGHIGQSHRLTIIGASDSGAVYALSPTDGATLWKSQAGDRIVGCPAIADVDADGHNEVIVASYDTFVYALSGDDGHVKWKFRTGGAISGAPVVARLSRGNKFPEVVVATQLGTVYCLRGDGKATQWEKKFPRSIVASPVVGDIKGDKNLAVVIEADDGSITVLEGYSGEQILRYSIAGARGGSLATIDLNRDNKSEVISAGLRVEAFGNLRAGWGEFWSYTGSDESFAAGPAIGDVDGDGIPEVVAVSRDGVLHCINALTGKGKWKTKISSGSPPGSSPAIADVTGERKAAVIVSTPAGHLMALSGQDGKELWDIDLEGYADTSPVVFSTDGGKTLNVATSEAATQTVRAYQFNRGGQIFWGKSNGNATNTGAFSDALAYGNVLRGIELK